MSEWTVRVFFIVSTLLMLKKEEEYLCSVVVLSHQLSAQSIVLGRTRQLQTPPPHSCTQGAPWDWKVLYPPDKMLQCPAVVVVKKSLQLHELLLPLPFWWHEVSPWQMLHTTLTRLSMAIPLSRVGRIWWTWRKEATRTQTSTSLTSSRTVILKSSPGCQ